MKEAYRLTRKDGAPGIDGVTAADYEVNLEANLLDLLDRIKSGRYRAPPVRRAYIPKADGSQRMLGIPTFEDKVAQRAVTMVLEEIYEQDFLSCSYGFRRGRSAHQALRTLQNVLWTKRLYWVLDIDIRKYFDSISHCHLRAFLDQRVTDGVIRRMKPEEIGDGERQHHQHSGHHAREDVKQAPICLWAEDCFVVAQKQQEVARTRQQYAGQGLYCVGEPAKGAIRRRRGGASSLMANGAAVCGGPVETPAWRNSNRLPGGDGRN